MNKITERTLYHYINGEKVGGTSGRLGDIFNPATGEICAKVPLANKADVQQAVQAAAAALPTWASTPPLQRARILMNFRALVLQHQDEIITVMSQEHGKTLPDSLGDLTRGLEVVEFAMGIPQLLKGDFSENVANAVDSYAIRQPVGVCVGITPFNFPAMVPLWMFPIALACGNTFVLKPSEKVPSTSLLLAELLTKAGLPKGVFNVVNGEKEAVDTLLTAPDVAAISFVGSTLVGEYIYKVGCEQGKRVQALCGAKNHLVVMPDADMNQVVDAIIGAAYGSAGERCMAISVVVPVGEETAQRLRECLIPRIRALKIGGYTDEKAEMGPLITMQHLQKVKSYVALGVDEGAELVIDGRDVQVVGGEKGFFLGGCLFDHVTANMRIYKEEIFGPVLALVRVESYGEAVQLVNAHEYGNGAAIFTRDGDCARNFTHTVNIGMVGVNVPIPVPVAYNSFGGWKRSLFGDHAIHGTEGVHFYTRLKTITTRWTTGIRGAQFHFKGGSEH
ncbi:CoA-acylating methylmalonate-semialdehyde dehydrogenase [Beggiatoa leptomitoformis]|uniref:methylmalonate-semialdehyde dehydrogenase (CoA acylating) n=1 Tax=Beggiatoa leptomitoformis TaxID=288004 RepID=A0A2N9YDS5_9GAMM|nr:CoA-acylating methylmalonate-semialdehyde dehydrogenase [Beggiatoa leptomitoformis]ALG69074.1 CoA-acylating methylmalonate-semialdehyde dehydrogenase [Beggiatoa leptomitoformis]AUI68515.1 CoA-acylating methylmalonate-semialdehyde dehydrogenase [Beggiatoa leptomitoformis]